MNWSVLGHYMLAADIHTRRSIGQIGLAAAIGMFLMHDRSGRAND